MSNANNSGHQTISAPVDVVFSYPVRFCIFLLGEVPSIICSLFVLYHLLFDRTLRRALHNHVIIVLLVNGLISELTDIPWILHFYLSRTALQSKPTFCLIWSFIDNATFVIQLVLFAWASIERHILIFHDSWVSTTRRRFFVHYLPLVTLLVYCLIFYSFVYFFPPCRHSFNYSSILCVTSCLSPFHTYNIWRRIFNTIGPTIVIALFSTALLLRVLWQKRQMHRGINWRNHRKMTIQLLSISTLYILLALPYMLISFAWILGMPSNVSLNVYVYVVFFSYFIVFPHVFKIASIWMINRDFKKNRRLYRNEQERLFCRSVYESRSFKAKN